MQWTKRSREYTKALAPIMLQAISFLAGVATFSDAMTNSTLATHTWKLNSSCNAFLSNETFIKGKAGVCGGFHSFLPILVLKFWPWYSNSIINPSWADRHKVSYKICFDVRLLTPSSAFGRWLGLVLFFEITLGTEDDAWGASVHPRASDSWWWRHILSLKVFCSMCQA